MDKLTVNGLLREYAALRERNEQEGQRRQQEIGEKYPELAQLLHERHEMVMSSVMRLFPDAADDPEQKMAAYNRRIAGLLRQYGYPEDYLSPIHRCPVCDDYGYVYRNARQVLCECLRRRLTANPSDSSGETFDSFDESRFPEDRLPGSDVTQRQYMLLMRDKCRSFAGNVPDGPVRTLLLHGGSGLGKTFLLHCVEDDARSRGVGTAFVTAYDLLTALKNARFGGDNEAAAHFMNVPLLLIDDLGMEPMMENITVEEIYHLLNERLNRGLYTAFSTNLSRTELKQKYTERVTSRLLDTRRGMALQLLGQDIRLMK